MIARHCNRTSTSKRDGSSTDKARLTDLGTLNKSVLSKKAITMKRSGVKSRRPNKEARMLYDLKEAVQYRKSLLQIVMDGKGYQKCL